MRRGMLALMDATDELRVAERELQAAILAADRDVLERMLDDRHVHIGGDGSPQDKASLIEARLSGNMHLAKLEEQAFEAIIEGTTGITRVTVALTGRTQDVLYSMRVVVTRTWTRRDAGWTVLAEHLSVVEPRDFTVTATTRDEVVPRSPGRLRRVE